MKIKGTKVTSSNVYTVVIPKADQDYVFKIGPADFEAFDNLCPRPEPKQKIKPGSSTPIKDVSSPEYTEAIQTWAQQRTEFMMISSLSHTPDLEFDTVDMADSATWGNYAEELKEAGFTDGEIIALMNKASAANGLNNAIIDKATEDFLALERQLDSTSQ